MPADSRRLPVAKTYKLFIGGAFPRSESGRSIEVTNPRTEAPIANVAWASRKDVRDAVSAARSAVGGWSAATPYNRGQVLYRIAEMLEGRSAQLVEELSACGHTPAKARREVGDAIDAWVYYAGFADKYQQLVGTVNPVAAPFFNFTLAEPMGVVALVAPDETPLLGLTQVLAPVMASGNTAVLVAAESNRIAPITFAEVIATSDVPGGVVNILTGYRSELVPVLARHMDVNGLDLRGCAPDDRPELERLAVDNLKRTWASAAPSGPGELAAIERATEAKTIWHPVGV